jgi:hypothetical protein
LKIKEIFYNTIKGIGNNTMIENLLITGFDNIIKDKKKRFAMIAADYI